MSVIRRCRGPKTRRRLWSDDTGPCVSPTDTPPIPTTLDAMEEASEGSQPENVAPTEAIAVPDTPDDAENRDEEKEDNEPAPTVPEPPREEGTLTYAYAVPYPANPPDSKESGADKRARQSCENLDQILCRAFDIRAAVRIDPAATALTKHRICMLYREMDENHKPWNHPEADKKSERPHSVHDRAWTMLLLVREMCRIVESDPDLHEITKERVASQHRTIMRLSPTVLWMDDDEKGPLSRTHARQNAFFEVTEITDDLGLITTVNESPPPQDMKQSTRADIVAVLLLASEMRLTVYKDEHVPESTRERVFALYKRLRYIVSQMFP